jgi:hypothetical protein
MSNPANGRTGNRLGQMQEQITHIPEQMVSYVEDRPLASVAAAFGAGLIAGVGLVALYCQMQHQETTVDSLTHRISDAIRNAMPQQLTSSFR